MGRPWNVKLGNLLNVRRGHPQDGKIGFLGNVLRMFPKHDEDQYLPAGIALIALCFVKFFFSIFFVNVLLCLLVCSFFQDLKFFPK